VSLEIRQQLLENLCPVPVDFPSECIIEAGRMSVELSLNFGDGRAGQAAAVMG
jgi:hypothetical protein